MSARPSRRELRVAAAQVVDELPFIRLPMRRAVTEVVHGSKLWTDLDRLEADIAKLERL